MRRLAISTAIVGLASLWAAQTSAQVVTLLNEDFSGATPGTHGGGVIAGTQFAVTEANVDIVGVLNGSFFTCDRVPGGNCVDLVGDLNGGAISSVPTFDLAAGSIYRINFGALLQGFPVDDPAESQFRVSLGSLSRTLIATPAGGSFHLNFAPSSDEAGARLGFTTLTAPDNVHGAVVDNIVLAQAAAVAGDYNRNGVVDAADYVVWRYLRGETGEGLAADGSGPGGMPDGVVDQFDYAFWVAHFGETASSGGAAKAAATDIGIPEPTALALALGAVAAVAVGRVSTHLSHERGSRNAQIRDVIGGRGVV